ncbi:DUF1127 domain-containing protein [Chromohalobacter japonicus]|uniref:DUF1127 domain-containing protein n=1 Tax=Chromohalobacter japonicus TaxID=223900 RepID=UPI001FF5E12D|nr:DUF1127 domain-containing protein [Chromohalobacter japonicus]MCK0753491.1 DUF1127 domain-containing protein [Chromohalobacter japonicus]
MHPTPLHRLIATLRLYRRRYSTRQQLRGLDARLLDDIGITLVEARRESFKHFWKA